MQCRLPEKYTRELPFIREILFDVTDEAPGMIYADWLDERNDPRGEFLRIEMRLEQAPSDDSELQMLRERRDDVIGKLDPQWVSLLARAPIELCPQKVEFKGMCPRRWENLKPFSDNHSVRYCDQCGRSVTYCFTIAEARTQAMCGQCVVIDNRMHRLRDDVQLIALE